MYASSKAQNLIEPGALRDGRELRFNLRVLRIGSRSRIDGGSWSDRQAYYYERVKAVRPHIAEWLAEREGWRFFMGEEEGRAYFALIFDRATDAVLFKMSCDGLPASD